LFVECGRSADKNVWEGSDTSGTFSKEEVDYVTFGSTWSTSPVKFQCEGGED